MMWMTILACSGGGLGSSVVSNDAAALSPLVSTVLEVTFSLDQTADVSVTYTLSDEDAQSTPTQSMDAGDHLVRVLGLPAQTDVTWSVVAVDTDFETHSGAGGTVTTGSLPSTVPDLTVDTLVAENTDEPWMLGTVLSDEGTDMTLISDRDGNIVWYRETPESLTSTWVTPAADGTGGLLVNDYQQDFCGEQGQVTQLDLSGNELVVTPIPDGHRVFFQHDDGTLAYLARDAREHGGFEEPVCGDRVIELSPDGTSRELFNAWDHYEPVANGNVPQGYYCDCLDWTHADSLAWNPTTNSYLLGFANTSTLVEFDRDSGEILRQFGEEAGSYTFDPPIGAFGKPHGARFTAAGTLLLTRTNDAVQETTAAEYLIDDDAQSLTQDWIYGVGEGFYVASLGEVHRLENQNTLVNFGSDGVLHEVTPLGAVVWEAHVGEGLTLGHTMMIGDLYGLEGE